MTMGTASKFFTNHSMEKLRTSVPSCYESNLIKKIIKAGAIPKETRFKYFKEFSPGPGDYATESYNAMAKDSSFSHRKYDPVLKKDTSTFGLSNRN
jgi:hypothetical protein